MPGKVERKKESQKARKPEREIDRDEYISNRRRKRVNFRHVKRVNFRRAKRGPDRDSSHRDLAGFEPRTCSHGNPRVSPREAKRSLCLCRTCPPEVAGPLSNGTSGSVEKIHFRGPCQLKHWKLLACLLASLLACLLVTRWQLLACLLPSLLACLLPCCCCCCCGCGCCGCCSCC